MSRVREREKKGVGLKVRDAGRGCGPVPGLDKGSWREETSLREMRATERGGTG